MTKLTADTDTSSFNGNNAFVEKIVAFWTVSLGQK